MADEIIITAKSGGNGAVSAVVCIPNKHNCLTHTINQAIEQANAVNFNNDKKIRINYHPSGYYTA